MNKKKRTIVWIVILIIILTGAGGAGSIYYYFFAKQFQLTKTTYIYIDRDDNLDSVYHKIIRNGHPKSMFGFQYLAEKEKYGDNIRTGRYALNPSDNMRYLFRRLSMGYQTPINLTVPSVRTVDRLVRAVSRQLMIDSLDIAKLISDSAYCAQMGYTQETLPSLFIPNTYEVYWNMSADAFMKRMQKEHAAFWNNDRLKKAQHIGLTPEEVSTLASIVEEETANGPEKPMVAGLYINRLNKGMLLQADPTVKFGLQEFGLKRILFKHLEVDSPYNTYKHAGLPPGPIRIPSIQGLESVLNYTQHHYIYMCAKEDFSGTHNFAVTAAQHQANARRYQQALNRRKIKGADYRSALPMDYLMCIYRIFQQPSFVLSFFPGHLSIFHCMYRTNMVTSQTLSTVTSPNGTIRHCYIAHRTNLLTLLTTNASFRCMKRLGRHQKSIEKRAQQIGFSKWKRTFMTIILFHLSP